MPYYASKNVLNQEIEKEPKDPELYRFKLLKATGTVDKYLRGLVF